MMRRRLAWSAIVVALAAIPGCVAVAPPAKQRGSPEIKWSIAERNGGHVLAATARGSAPANTFVTFERETWPPFRVEATLGPADAERAEGLAGGGFGIEMDLPGAFPPTQFWFVSVQLLPQGAQAYSGSHLSAPATHGSTLFADTLRVEVAIEHDGNTVSFFARPAGSDTWTPLGTANATGQGLPLYPALGAFRIARPGEVTFDGFRMVFRGDPQRVLTAAEEALELVYDAGDALLDVAHRVDGPAPDLTGAAADLRAADAVFADAEMRLLALAEKRKKSPLARVLASVRKARTQVESAADAIDAESSPSSVWKRVMKALDATYDAAERLESEGE